MTVFGGKSGKNAPNMSFFGALRANRRTFLLIYSKSAENKMSFEIHVTTIATGSLSFGLKKSLSFFGCWVFSGLSFFENVKKKPELRPLLFQVAIPQAIHFLVSRWCVDVIDQFFCPLRCLDDGKWADWFNHAWERLLWVCRVFQVKQIDYIAF